MRNKGRAILVEGYMDAISYTWQDFTKPWRRLETAFDGKSGRVVKAICKVLYVCYDADTCRAGSSNKGYVFVAVVGLASEGSSVASNVDPDEFLQKEGSNAFEDLLSKSLPLPLYHLEIREEFFED